jgi:hypothetical protein
MSIEESEDEDCPDPGGLRLYVFHGTRHRRSARLLIKWAQILQATGQDTDLALRASQNGLP